MVGVGEVLERRFEVLLGGVDELFRIRGGLSISCTRALPAATRSFFLPAVISWGRSKAERPLAMITSGALSASECGCRDCFGGVVDVAILYVGI